MAGVESVPLEKCGRLDFFHDGLWHQVDSLPGPVRSASEDRPADDVSMMRQLTRPARNSGGEGLDAAVHYCFRILLRR